MPVQDFVNVQEAAAIIGCTDGRIRQMLLDGTMQGVKANERAWLIPRKIVDREARKRRDKDDGRN